jgi:hypothetical protein
MTDRNEYERRIRESVVQLRDAFRPVLHAVEGSGGRRVTGTAFVVADNATRFVISAWHVVRGPEPRYFGVIGGSTVQWPKRYSKLRGLESGLPEPDVAWAKATALQGDTSLAASIPMSHARGAGPHALQGAYLAVGYPVSKAKLRYATDTLSSGLAVVPVHCLSRSVSSTGSR